ncbi:Thivi_2564 family membrane protein [Novosphingobium sp.]|uniref:Thivi_2564 family membrane protein n=1 Tax=Novosphingobium sp. TaxID=1874826 RepID=UPI003D0A398B
MDLINVIIVLMVVGVLLWLVNTYLPMQGTIKSILNAVVVIAVVLWLLRIFGLLDTLSSVLVHK